MKVLDLFSGIGGFSLGLERAGMETVAFCEIEEFPRKVLKRHWPEIPIYEDVKELTAKRLISDGITGINVICGGFPCQDISNAGKRAGIEGDRSGLWSEIARLISELRPQYAIMENVSALLGRGLGKVLGDLSEIGYDAEWHCLPASYISAPHRRDRVWILAYPSEKRFAGQVFSLSGAKVHEDWFPTASLLPAYSDGMVTADGSYSLRAGDGFSEFMGEINGYGNAVVPQIPEMIGMAIMAASK